MLVVVVVVPFRVSAQDKFRVRVSHRENSKDSSSNSQPQFQLSLRLLRADLLSDTTFYIHREKKIG